MNKLDIYWCRGCDKHFATEANGIKPLCCPNCLQQQDFIYKKTIEVPNLEEWS